MIVISIGTERKLFSENPTRSRILDMGRDFEKYHLIVLTPRGFNRQLSGNAHLYPTNSLSKALYIFDALKMVLRIIKSLSHADRKRAVLTAQDPFECGLVAYVASKLYGIPLHLQIHTDLFSPFFINTFLQRLRMIVAPIIIRHAHAIRCDSARIAAVIKMKRMSSAPIAVLPIFIDVQKYDHAKPASIDVHPLFKENRFVVLMASRLELEKEIASAIDVFSRILRKFPQRVGLVIVGSGSLEQELKNKVKKLGLEDDVKFVAWTNDLQSYYKSADLFLMTSRFEGYGLTITESLLCGTPVLSSDVGVAPEVLIEGKTGWIYPPCNSVALENKLEHIIRDPDVYSQTKIYLDENPYVHAYADLEMYRQTFTDNIAMAIEHKKTL